MFSIFADLGAKVFEATPRLARGFEFPPRAGTAFVAIAVPARVS